MRVNYNIIIIAFAAVMSTGCASVNMAPQQESDQAKQFDVPGPGNAGLYVYRNSFVGKALKKDLWVDGKELTLIVIEVDMDFLRIFVADGIQEFFP